MIYYCFTLESTTVNLSQAINSIQFYATKGVSKMMRNISTNWLEVSFFKKFLYTIMPLKPV